MSDVKHTKEPEVIFLQWYGDSEPYNGEINSSDVSWCIDKIYEHDIQYVRHDIYAADILTTKKNLERQNAEQLAEREESYGLALSISQHVTNEHEKRIADIERQNRELRESASRWDAIINCARIDAQGCAGIDKPNPDHYAHIGFAMWSIHPEREHSKYSREWLTKFADICIAAQSDKALQGQEG